MTELQARMTQAEFEGWKEFYVRFPFDDGHRFHRPAALVYSAAFAPDSRAEAAGDAMRWLAPQADDMSDADRNTMRALGFDEKGDSGPIGEAVDDPHGE